MGKNHNHIDWENVAGQVQDVLGDQFWQDLQGVIPKKGPAIDLFETNTECYIYVELPGLHSVRDVQITISGCQLTIIGNIPYPYPLNKDDLIIHERYLGAFKRQLSLPFNISSKNVKAHYRNGVLIISLIKEVQEQTIPVSED
ncbi:Hsp20/alpha crystallin family protein [Cytobacillus spongiae]|jgi:HSP20 family protein|uniref:Hsp20/alpha crystallin family protein n=1 Tax=Cytobacillus spongiae TaxID=2901381 RepID=UPI001F4690DE|nr:Hsp20/alpha crystallin family protein [Cytobacillus spongiae]UII56451.1 Hsp20/alpha crystallin family protein [Cytobacillus spongiae]